MAQYITRTFKHKVTIISAPGKKVVEFAGGCDIPSTVFLYSELYKVQPKDVTVKTEVRTETRRMTVDTFLENSEPVPEKKQKEGK